MTEDDSGDNEEAEVLRPQTLAQTLAQENAKIAQPSSLRRPRRDDNSDEENLRSLIPQSKKVKLETVDDGSLYSTLSHAPRRTSPQIHNSGQSVYLGQTAVTATVEAATIKTEEVK